MYEDNIPCIKIAEEPRQHQRVKHVDIKYMFIRDLVLNNQMKLKHISSYNQIADVMTKPIVYSRFTRHVDNLGLRGSVKIPM
jgi:hypothetical protein